MFGALLVSATSFLGCQNVLSQFPESAFAGVSVSAVLPYKDFLDG
jgi:hypothetical protein